MVNGLPPDRHGTEIPVKESREMRYFIRMTSLPFAAIGVASLGLSNLLNGDGSIALLLIHHVDQWLAGCEPLDVLAYGAYHTSVIPIRTSGHVRRDDHVVEFP